MNLDSADRQIFARLADLLIPAGNGFPSASEAAVANEGLDQVLAVRPDLLDPLRSLLRRAKDRAPSEFFQELQRTDPATFGVLAELVPGAYFLNADVRAKLKYDGQSARSINPRADYLDDGLLQSVIDRGPIYRPTPPAQPSPTE
jgi:hypothetical protein